MSPKKVILAALSAIMLLSVIAGTASASRSFEVSEPITTLLSRAFSVGSTELGALVTCEVGITITLNARNMTKRPVTPIGRSNINVLGQEARAERCSRAGARLLAGPFNVNYVTFFGTLPNIIGFNIQFLAVRLLIEFIAGVSCLYTMNMQGFQRINALTIAELRGESAGERFRLETVRAAAENGVFCPRGEGITLEGSFASQRAVRIRLI